MRKSILAINVGFYLMAAAMWPNPLIGVPLYIGLMISFMLTMSRFSIEQRESFARPPVNGFALCYPVRDEVPISARYEDAGILVENWPVIDYADRDVVGHRGRYRVSA